MLYLSEFNQLTFMHYLSEFNQLYAQIAHKITSREIKEILVCHTQPLNL